MLVHAQLLQARSSVVDAGGALDNDMLLIENVVLIKNLIPCTVTASAFDAETATEAEHECRWEGVKHADHQFPTL